MQQGIQRANRKKAITAGLAYLLIFLFSITTNFFVFEQLLVSGDVPASLQNIRNNALLFRIGITLWVLVLICDTVVAWALYELFEPVHRSLAGLATVFRLLFVVLFTYSLIAYFGLEKLAADLYGNQEAPGIAAVLLHSAYYAVRISYVFFGLHILILGVLARKSGWFHAFAPILLFVAAIGYLTDSFLNFLSASYGKSGYGFLLVVGLPALLAELTLTIELLVVVGRLFKKAKKEDPLH